MEITKKENMKNRRDFLKLAMLSSVGIMMGCTSKKQEFDQTLKYGAKRKFIRKFTPRFSMGYNFIAGKDPFKRMQFFHDAGFTAVEGVVFVTHNGKNYTEAQKQQQIALGKMARELGLEMGNVSSMNDKDFAMMGEYQLPIKDKYVSSKEGLREELVRRMEKTFGVLERLGSKEFIIGAGTKGSKLSATKQMDNTIENMAFCADYVAKRGYKIVIEPLNTISHPNIFIDNATMGAEIVRAVNKPSCRLLYDIFHEQMQVGNLNSLDDDKVWNCIESFHIADAPQRCEPTSGVIDYAKVLDKIWDKGFRGFLGLEHRQTENTKECELRILEIYRKLDKQS